VTERVRWTKAGRAALADIGGDLYRDATDAELRRKVFATAKLLDKIIDDPSLKYHREDLEKLRATAGKPGRARRRS